MAKEQQDGREHGTLEHYDFKHGTGVRYDEHPELYQLAVAAISDGDGTFEHGGQRWCVGVIEAGKYVEIYPERTDT